VGLERSTVLFRDQRRSPLHPAPAGRLQTLGHAAADQVASEIAIGSELGFDATMKLPGEGFNRAWPPLIKMDESVKTKVEVFFTL
jgi:hypothetical protein